MSFSPSFISLCVSPLASRCLPVTDILHPVEYVVEGHRFDIFEQIGCYPALYNTPLTYFISLMWPPVIGIISAVYGVMSLRAFTRRRAAFAELLSAHNSLTPGRYLRLMALAATDILLTTPLGIFTIVLNLTASPVGPWRSWADTHFDYSRVEQFPAILWRSSRLTLISIQFTRWASPATALIFFAFFGFAVEARKNYALVFGLLVAAFWRVLARLGVQRPTSGFLAPKCTTTTMNSSRGLGYIKPPPSKRSPTATEDISLPAYSPNSGTGSFTESFASVADLKRAASFASQGASSTTTSSRFVEGFVLEEEDEMKVQDEEKAMSIHEALSLPPRRSPSPSSAYIVQHPALDRNSTLNPETPGTATSFASTTTEYVIPLHVGWNSRPYPADVEEVEEDSVYSPDSTQHAFPPSPISTTISTSPPSRFSYPQTRNEQLSRGPRSLV